MEVSRVDQRLGFVVGLIPVPLPEAAKAEVGSSVSEIVQVEIHLPNITMLYLCSLDRKSTRLNSSHRT